MSKPELLNFSVCTSTRDIQGAFAVRSIVFIDEQQCPFDEEFDEWDQPDADTIHMVGMAGQEPAAAGRIRSVSGVAKLERLSIRRAWRGNGEGHRLLEFVIQVAAKRGFDRYKLHAQAHLTGFYEQHGFVSEGPLFSEAGIDHRLMRRS